MRGVVRPLGYFTSQKEVKKMENPEKYINWSREDWSFVELGDKRLTNRAVKIGAAFLSNPFVSPPKMLKSSKDLKAFYRFMDSDNVSHEKLIMPHIKKTCEELSKQKIILAIQDSTTLIFKRNYEIDGLYDVGNVPGLVVHNTISVIPYSEHCVVHGLLNQIINKRVPKENRCKKDSEIRLWTQSVESVGKPAENTIIIDVMDRGADAAQVMHCSLENKHEFIIRAQYSRYIEDEEYSYLFELAKSLPVSGQKELEIQGTKSRKKRIAKLDISFSNIRLKSPRNQQQYPPVDCAVIRVYEVNAPKGEKPLEWFLLTSLEVSSLEDALQVIQFYTYRWIIEEYHKCLKTGFRIEETQMKELCRIEALLGMISISSIKLLQMRDIVKHEPEAEAIKYVEEEDIKIVKAYYKIKESHMTIDRFLRYIAQMGGFLNRKGDGNPGWQSLWEGWKFFMGLKEGVRLSKEVTCG